MWSEPHLTQLNSLMKLLVPFVILEHMQILFLCFKYYFTELKKVIVQGNLRLHSVESKLSFEDILCF